MKGQGLSCGRAKTRRDLGHGEVVKIQVSKERFELRVSANFHDLGNGQLAAADHACDAGVTQIVKVDIV